MIRESPPPAEGAVRRGDVLLFLYVTRLGCYTLPRHVTFRVGADTQMTAQCAPWRLIPLRSAIKQRRALCDGTAPRAMAAHALLYVKWSPPVDGAADRAIEVSAKMRGSVPRTWRQFRRSQSPTVGEATSGPRETSLRWTSHEPTKVATVSQIAAPRGRRGLLGSP